MEGGRAKKGRVERGELVSSLGFGGAFEREESHVRGGEEGWEGLQEGGFGEGRGVKIGEVGVPSSRRGEGQRR